MPVLRVICLIFSRGADFAPGGANFAPPLGEFGGWFLKKKFSDSESEFHKFFVYPLYIFVQNFGAQTILELLIVYITKNRHA